MASIPTTDGCDCITIPIPNPGAAILDVIAVADCDAVEFPIALFVYDDDLPDIFAVDASGASLARRMNCNLIITDAHFEDIAADRATLDTAEGLGLKVVFLLDRYCTCLVDNIHVNEGWQTLLYTWINGVKRQRALYGYALCDEPDDVGGQRLTNHLAITALIKTLDVGHYTIGIFTADVIATPAWVEDPNLDIATFSRYLTCTPPISDGDYQTLMGDFAAVVPEPTRLGIFAPAFTWTNVSPPITCTQPTLDQIEDSLYLARAASPRYEWLGYWAYEKPQGNANGSPCGAGVANPYTIDNIKDLPALAALVETANCGFLNDLDLISTVPVTFSCPETLPDTSTVIEYECEGGPVADVGFPVSALTMMEDCQIAGLGFRIPVLINAPQVSNVIVDVELTSGNLSDLPGAPAALDDPGGVPVTILAGDTLAYLTLPSAPNNATVGANTPLEFTVVSVSGGHAIGGVYSDTLTISFLDDDAGGDYRPCAIPTFNDVETCGGLALDQYQTDSVAIVEGDGEVSLSGGQIIFTASGTPGVVVIEATNGEGSIQIVIVVTGEEGACTPMTLVGSPLSLGCGAASALTTANAVGTVTWTLSNVNYGALTSGTGDTNTFTAIETQSNGSVIVTATDSIGQTAQVSLAIRCNVQTGGGGTGNCVTACDECPSYECDAAITACEIRDQARRRGLFFGDPRVDMRRSEGYQVGLTQVAQSIYANDDFAPCYAFTPDCNEQVKIEAIFHFDTGGEFTPGTADVMEIKIVVNGVPIAYDFPVLNAIGAEPRLYVPLTGLFVAMAGQAYTVCIQARNVTAAQYQVALRSALIARAPLKD